MSTSSTVSIPYSHSKCYACDAEACGVRDRQLEGGDLEAACARHADPKIKAHPGCMYCGGRVRSTSALIDGYFAHKSCYAEDVAGG